MRRWWRLGAAAAALCAALLVAGLGGSAPDAASAQRKAAAATVAAVPCPASPSKAKGPSYAGQQLAGRNFSRQDLTNADFSGATITGGMFLHANLTGANFSGATIKADAKPTDFSFANLNAACFQGARFEGVTYFTYARLSCTDFSRTDISARVVFGDAALNFDAGPCRPAFRDATLNCEFFAQWSRLDLSGANIAACRELIKPGADFSGAMFAGVVFDGLDLSGTHWRGAVLENASFVGATLDNATGLDAATLDAAARLSGARFNNASVKNVDFSNAELYGADFTRANLENSRLQGARLTSNAGGTPRIDTAASFDSAHLKNVDLSGAKLNSVSFANANFYGVYNALDHGPPAKFPCVTDTRSCGTTRVTGFTCSCATARGADLTKTSFTNAYLYGADFGGGTTTINGTDFTGAILVAANFNAAAFSVDTQGGAGPKFANAYLQGADFGGALLSHTVLTNAFVDFRSGGNVMQVLLDEKHTVFRGWKAQAKAVCVQTNYLKFVTRLPSATPTMTCPDGVSHPNGCGSTVNPPANSAWKSPLDIEGADPPGFYVDKPTFGNAKQNDPRCNQGKRDTDW